MRYLSLDWFKSKIEKAVEIATEKVVTKKIENLVEELSETPVEVEKPYHSSIQVNNTLTVVLNNGHVLTKQSVESIELEKCRTEEDVIKLMSTKEVLQEKEKIEEVKKEIELIQSNFDILVETGDFEVRDNSVYLKGINRSMPKLLINKFSTILKELKGTYLHNEEYLSDLKDDIEYQSLIRFWKKCCLNPNSRSSEDLFEFLEKHNMKITKNGNFLGYRAVDVVDTGTSKQLVEFISNAYNKVKAVWKKAPKSFKVITIPNSNVFELKPFSFNVENTDYICLGDLEFLYLNLPNMQENRYTDNHSRKMDYRVGQVAQIPRNEGSDDNTVSCGRGLHIANREFDYSGFGTQNVLAIVNPIDVLAAPLEDRGKLRTSRWFFAMTLTPDEKRILDEECFDVTHLDDIFEEKCLEDLEEHVKRGFTEEVKRHTFTIPNISANEITNICKSLTDIQEELKQRVVNI